jgi:tRNA (guanine37-N1)-methyltransferase
LLRAQGKNLLEVAVHDIRAWTEDKHHVTDEPPYGGGGGMVMKPDPIFAAVESVLGAPADSPDSTSNRAREPGSPSHGLVCPLVLLTPQGRLFSQSVAQELAAYPRLALLCGRYEGVDERVREHLVSHEISIGDYVLTGGELPALLVIDAVARLLPGVLGDPDGALDDSHASGLLEYPHYTRPVEFRGWRVPEVLLSGNHAQIARWRREQSLLRTLQRRPDLLAKSDLSAADRIFLESLRRDIFTHF